MKKKSNLEKARMRVEAAIGKTNVKIDELGARSSHLYDGLNALQSLFDEIRSVPDENRLEFERMKKVRLNWKRQAQKIEDDFAAARAKNVGKGAAGAGAGIAVAALGPTAAMGFATTFGVASTGTAISTLSGATATNAALAWLGGGALAAGGGGMAAGEAFLAFAGPAGWAIAAVAMLGSGVLLLKGRSDKKRIENIFELISKRDSKSYELAIVELEERIRRIEDERTKLEEAFERTSSFGTDYNAMEESQQYELGTYVNLMNSATQLLVNPILGLQPKYTEADLNEYASRGLLNIDPKMKALVVQLCNLLYRIDLDEKDWKLLHKTLRGNKELLSQLDLKKADFDEAVIVITKRALWRKYQREGL